MSVISFENHPPVRVSDDAKIETVWDAGQDFGAHRLKSYKTKAGPILYWFVFNSGCTYNGHEPETRRYYMSSVKAIKSYCEENSINYHSQIEALVDESAIQTLD